MNARTPFTKMKRALFPHATRAVCLAVMAVLLPACSLFAAPTDDRSSTTRPNIIVILADDLGYGDPGVFGADPSYVKTPHIDRIAERGIKLTHFYAAPNCTPARAMLMTGRYPRRVGLATGVEHSTLFPGDAKGLNPDEITTAELLRDAGYRTYCVGKWHLGDQPPFLPARHGFDEFYGLPYSHDMYPPTRPEKYDFPPLPLLQNNRILEINPQLSTLTKRYTEQAVSFIRKQGERPFFLYLPHSMPHRPLRASENFRDRFSQEKLNRIKPGDKSSSDFLYPAAIEELDWSVGRIVSALRKQNLLENTLLIFTSDNGPKVGKTGPLRGGKGQVYEGGVRVPFVAQWPDAIPAGSKSNAVTSLMDLLPTFAHLAGEQPPDDRRIDGHDIRPILKQPEQAGSPDRPLLHYDGKTLKAVQVGQWKLHLKRNALYNLHEDVSEQENVADEHPDLVRRLKRRANVLHNNIKVNKRPAARVDQPRPIITADGSLHPDVENPTGVSPGNNRED